MEDCHKCQISPLVKYRQIIAWPLTINGEFIKARSLSVSRYQTLISCDTEVACMHSSMLPNWTLTNRSFHVLGCGHLFRA